jgi:hypothetical protein
MGQKFVPMMERLSKSLPPGEFEGLQYAISEGYVKIVEGIFVTDIGKEVALECTKRWHYPVWLSLANNEMEVEIVDPDAFYGMEPND